MRYNSGAMVRIWKVNKKRFIIIPCDLNPEMELDVAQGLVVIRYRIR